MSAPLGLVALIGCARTCRSSESLPQTPTNVGAHENRHHDDRRHEPPSKPRLCHAVPTVRIHFPHDRAAGLAQRASPVAPAEASPAARRKAAIRRTQTGEPVVSFRSLLRHLACLTRNTVHFGRDHTTTLFARPTPLHRPTRPTFFMSFMLAMP
jgi:hypothetical protein